MSELRDEPPRHGVVMTGVADAEVREAHEWLRATVGAGYADRWLEGLLRAVEGLATFPYRHPIARENDLSEVDIRRMLYYGPAGRRRAATTYRILFQVVEPQGDVEGIVRVLHVWHAARGRRLP